jgi:stage III sporulation protein AA
MQMNCAWKELLTILPQWMRQEVDRLGKDILQELRLRVNAPPELVLCGKVIWIAGRITQEDLQVCLQSASRYSPWAATTVASGYITAKGGHRIGLCGEALIKNGSFAGLRTVSSLCIRIARDFPGISRELEQLSGSTLILGAPGWGKTTLLRDLIRKKSEKGIHISVLDEREELFPPGISQGERTEVLRGCPKPQGVDMLLRVMQPDTIAMDEITATEDCVALVQAAWCGVELLATAHAASLEDFLHREVYAPLVKAHLFDNIVILRSDKSWHLERSKGWTTSGSVRY